MLRQIILDTETTGLDPQSGHRIIEIGCVEVINRRVSGNTFHRYLDPERPIDRGAEEVHGLTREFLQDKPKFVEIIDEFLSFIEGAELVIHNAPFDVSFLNAEFKRLKKRLKNLEEYCSITDTLAMARKMHPGQRNNLDALCKRYGVDNAKRDLHGGLLDANLLALTYLAMTSGQDNLFSVDNKENANDNKNKATEPSKGSTAQKYKLRVLKATDEELAAHEQRLAKIGKK
ncbi:MAG: DNA polymerase III subunit epsilon [Gammaproteobacteria bacterium]|nr:DNA polymerase III subunit epsilon [Gammaproteobacteria bacterium]